MGYEYRADNIGVDDAVYDSLHYYLDSKTPWHNLKTEESQILLQTRIDGIGEEEQYLVVFVYNSEDDLPKLTAMVVDKTGKALTMIAVFDKLEEYITLHYLYQEKIYIFKITHENTY
jgi:hypothetical protein